MYIQGKILNPGDDLAEALNIRKKVFVEEYTISYDKEFDLLDELAIHAVAYEKMSANENSAKSQEKKAVATGRIFYDGEKCILDKVSVLKEYRGKEYGDFVVRLLLNKAFLAGVNEVYADSFVSAEGFFEKIGFIRIDENFIENGIVKCKMVIKSEHLMKKCCIKNQ